MREKVMVEQDNAPYRVQVYVRRKGETVLDGEEFKTELFEDFDALSRSIKQFIDDTLEDDDEYVFRNAEGGMDYES